ncbi:MAG: DUF4346 domain-containing protein [Chloroflexi bacterium]|nr:DUF4346 domain-containing protein [Chloroflexota bacterium]
MYVHDPEPLAWDDDARHALERESIYLRERLRARVEQLLSQEGRRRATLADVDRARSNPAVMPRRQVPREPVHEPAWPATFGVYRVLDREGPIAICTLASEALMDALAAASPPGVAIVGRVFTENFGVEKVVTNLVASPWLRALVLCGTESRHKVGETLLALWQQGVEADGRVRGSSGPTPMVRSLPPEAVRLYQEKTEIVDLRGEERSAAILERVAQVLQEHPKPWPESWQPQVQTWRVGEGGTGTGGMSSRFTPDPRGIFLIGIGPSGRTIHAEHYTREGVLDHRVVGETAVEMCQALAQQELVGHMAHAIYLGRELQKAELALRLGLRYEQDRELELPFDKLRTAPGA